jgi:hypothetical protein
MSYLDVNVLRRFTKKLANSTMGAPDLSMGAAGDKPINTDTGPFGRPVRDSEMKGPSAETMGSGKIPEFSDTRPTRDLKGEPSVTIPGRSGSKQHIEGALADAGSLLESGKQRAGAAGSKMLAALKGLDLKTLGYGAGGAALGGAGAMALANLMRSKDDEEEQGTPVLAGLAGAGLGGVAGVYGPQIAAALGKYFGGKDAPSAASVSKDPAGERVLARQQAGEPVV